MAFAYDCYLRGEVYIDLASLDFYARLGVGLGALLGLTVGAVGALLQTTDPVNARSSSDWLRDQRAMRVPAVQVPGRR